MEQTLKFSSPIMCLECVLGKNRPTFSVEQQVSLSGSNVMSSDGNPIFLSTLTVDLPVIGRVVTTSSGLSHKKARQSSAQRFLQHYFPQKLKLCANVHNIDSVNMHQICNGRSQILIDVSFCIFCHTLS